MPTITADDGIQIFYKDWGPVDGHAVLLSHGWPLNSDGWESQALFLAEHGCRVIAHDRRGHGRSTQAWNGNDMDTYADDLATLLDTLDLTDVTVVGHSTGGGEVVRYTARHGCARVAKLVLVSAVPPFMLRTDDNPEGLPAEVFDAIRAGERASRSQLYRDLADGPFFGHNRRGDVPQGTRDAFWLQGLASGHRGAYECIAAFSATDFRGDLAEITVPTLVIHGDDDQIVPIEVGGLRSAKLIAGAALKVYEGAGHALPDTEKQRLSQDLLDFIES
ncbi:alpha/beta fold hydrolase [Nocardia sp. NPDC127606]|uniref:alpha/beta fold hydrolase n=1 Tax=Nocardia sp. NPDC127606 TaxID=3345406 RepID=UPI00363EF908